MKYQFGFEHLNKNNSQKISENKYNDSNDESGEKILDSQLELELPSCSEIEVSSSALRFSHIFVIRNNGFSFH